jgi:hypothetical protein
MLDAVHDFFQALEPYVEAPARAIAALYPTPNRVLIDQFFIYFLLSLCFCLCMFITSRAFTHAIVGKAYDKLLPSDRRTWHTNLVTFWPAFAVTAFALPAIVEFDVSMTSFASNVSPYTVKACGLAIGYMTWDLAVMLLNWADQCLAYGGKGAMYLFIVHHLLSIALWPYALTRGLCVYHINWFLVSEATNFNMSLRWYLVKLDKTASKAYLLNGLAWIPLFMGIRVVVIPKLFMLYFHGDWSVFTSVEYWLARTTLPIPSFLNVYWARQIVEGAVQHLIGESAPAKAAVTKSKSKSKSKKMN